MKKKGKKNKKKQTRKRNELMKKQVFIKIYPLIHICACASDFFCNTSPLFIDYSFKLIFGSVILLKFKKILPQGYSIAIAPLI